MPQIHLATNYADFQKKRRLQHLWNRLSFYPKWWSIDLEKFSEIARTCRSQDGAAEHFKVSFWEAQKLWLLRPKHFFLSLHTRKSIVYVPQTGSANASKNCTTAETVRATWTLNRDGCVNYTARCEVDRLGEGEGRPSFFSKLLAELCTYWRLLNAFLP